MPRWCENVLTISGNRKEVDKLVKFVEGVDAGGNTSCFTFKKIIPDDGVLLIKDWYHWNIARWGTKWDSCRPMFEVIDEDKKEKTVQYMFDTAWAPPIPVIEKLIKMFKSLDFDMKFREEGSGFCGTITGCDGVSSIEDDEVLA